jgi:hypothetical protein
MVRPSLTLAYQTWRTSMSLGDVFRTDLVLLHAPSVYDFRKRVVMHGPIADAVPATNEPPRLPKARPIFHDRYSRPAPGPGPGHLLDAQETLTLIDQAARLTPERRDEALNAIRRRVDEANEASLYGTDELKWPDVGRLALRPRLVGRLGLALWAELGHRWHRLRGTYDGAVFSGARLAPVEPGRSRLTAAPVPLGMPGRPPPL